MKLHNSICVESECAFFTPEKVCDTREVLHTTRALVLPQILAFSFMLNLQGVMLILRLFDDGCKRLFLYRFQERKRFERVSFRLDAIKKNV